MWIPYVFHIFCLFCTVIQAIRPGLTCQPLNNLNFFFVLVEIKCIICRGIMDKQFKQMLLKNYWQIWKLFESWPIKALACHLSKSLNETKQQKILHLNLNNKHVNFVNALCRNNILKTKLCNVCVTKLCLHYDAIMWLFQLISELCVSVCSSCQQTW